MNQEFIRININVKHYVVTQVFMMLYGSQGVQGPRFDRTKSVDWISPEADGKVTY
jgi:hypothetical protein